MTDIKELDDDCACGGGAISGHATGCPEAARFASPPSPAPAESGAVAWRAITPGDVKLTELLARVEAATEGDNALDMEIESALFKPDQTFASVRANSAGTKLIYKRHDGMEQTLWAYDYTLNSKSREAAVARINEALAALDSPPDHGGGEGDAGKKVADRCHPSHVTRISMDASSYDEICVKCGATDHIGGWGKLAKPCPCASLPTQESEDGR